MNLEDLPSYIYKQGSGKRYYLSVNRDIQGKWCIGYVNYENDGVLFGMNDFNDLNAAALSLGVRLNDAQRH